MTGSSIGKFITDNHEFLTQALMLGTLVIKMGRDFVVGKKKDAERRHKEEEAKVERNEIKTQLDANTKLTAHVLEATAQAAGVSVEDLIVGFDRDVDNLLMRFLTSSESGRLDDDRERARSGKRTDN